MRYRYAIIAYHPGGEIHVAERTDNPSWTERFSYVVDPGLVFAGRATREQEVIQMLTDFVQAVVLDGVKIDEADRAFRAIDRELLMERQ